ncbi:hypothetical protein RM549_10055 [Salegentibacter sp. F188]|uniref:SUEL-type lectin domain-containing protein n=1 Tax=Autumnicola patrickiae TaxID=3075591 RepID=A0ABU3E2A5_9FLAO|nr:hypothetical protein [Salegentibacter sp. F188]MDT0690128.1 hypothetical protein [Salegentibacter sp. F188]
MRNLKFIPCLFFVILFLGNLSVWANINKEISEEVTPIYGPYKNFSVPFLHEKEELKAAVFAPTITQQPTNQNVCANSTSTFSVIAQGENLTYKWQRNDGGTSTNFYDIGESWDFSGTNSSILTINGAAWLHDKSFRVKITDSKGVIVYSQSALLQYIDSPGYINQASNVSVCTGQNTYFETQSSETNFQWQVSQDGGNSWTDLVNDMHHQNVNLARMDILNAVSSMNNYFYRAKVSKNGCELYAEPSTLTVNDPPIVSNQPTDQHVPTGNTAVFEAAAEGANLSYRWQENSGYGWGDIYDQDNIFSGTGGTQLQVLNAQEFRHGFRYRLVVTNSSGCATPSMEALLSVGECPRESFNHNQESLSGTDTWIGHVYDGTTLNNYVGYYSEAETFSQEFGGDAVCFTMEAGGFLHTENFSVRYKMRSSRNGLYVVDLGSDDGSRLRIDGELVYNNWTDQTYVYHPHVLFRLEGNSSLEYEFYENYGGNRVDFTNLIQIMENKLETNINQNYCTEGTSSTIAGDSIGTLPTGISPVDTGYQWTYSTSPEGVRTNITGATSASFTPNVSSAPFNVPGTYYIFRNVTFSSSNNIGVNPYEVTHESNPAILNINASISNNQITYYQTGSVCATVNEGGNLNIVAPQGMIFTSVDFASYGTPNGTCENFSLGSCHAANSQSIVEGYLLGSNSAVIPATNIIFGDPCSGTVKRLYVQATYAEPTELLCSGTIPDLIVGSTPEGMTENSSYLWEVSTTGPDSGFSPAPGTNDQKDYQSGALFQTTWFRRSILNSDCNSSFSNEVEITVHPLPNATLNAPSTVCPGETIQISASFTGTAPWNVTANYGGVTTSFIVQQSPYVVNVTPTETTTYSVTGVTDTNGCFNDEDVSVTVNVNTTNTWTGDTSSDWNTTSNWSCSSLPTLTTDVLIPSGLTNYPVLSSGSDGLAKNVTIGANASVVVTTNQLQIAGTLTNSGTLNVESGNIAFVGSTAQVIPSGAFANNRIQNLTINNTAGVTSTATIELTGILKAENGNFETGGNITLISDAVQTALIDGSGSGEVTGLVDMQRFMDVAFGYKYFSSPVQPATVGDFSPYVDLTATFPNFYRYDENREITTPIADTLSTHASGWEAYTTSTSALNTMEGYAVNFGSTTDPVTVELTGEVNNGTFSKSLANNNKQYTKGFHLVGNPYPSPIDWDATSGWTKTNIDNGIYFFTAGSTNRYTGTYTSYVDGIASDGKASNIIPSMQGFFVKVSDSDTGADLVNANFGMTNSVRINNFSQPFLKTREPELKPLLRFSARFGNTENNDAMVIYFSPQSSTDFEKEKDAHKIMNTDVSVPNLYSISTDKKQLSINGLPFPDTRNYTKIPLGIKAEKSEKMTITLQDIQNLPLNFNVYLIDQEKKIGQNLMEESSYSFSIERGENNSRFHLIFSEEEITDTAIAFDEPFSLETGDGSLKVRLNLEDGQKGMLRASAVTGQILQVKEGTGQETVEFSAITSPGVYFINLYVGDRRFSKKVLIKN